MQVQDIPAEFLIGTIVTMVSTLGTVIAYLYKDLRAVLKAQVEAANAAAKQAEERAAYYARRDAMAPPRRRHDSMENFEE